MTQYEPDGGKIYLLPSSLNARRRISWHTFYRPTPEYTCTSGSTARAVLPAVKTVRKRSGGSEQLSERLAMVTCHVERVVTTGCHIECASMRDARHVLTNMAPCVPITKLIRFTTQGEEQTPRRSFVVENTVGQAIGNVALGSDNCCLWQRIERCGQQCCRGTELMETD